MPRRESRAPSGRESPRRRWRLVGDSGWRFLLGHDPWLAAACGFVVSLLAIFFTIYPIIDVPSPLIFATKIVAVTLTANAIGAAIFALGQRQRVAQQNSTA